MFINNVGFYPCRTKLYGWQILPVSDPQFLPPFNWTYWTHWIPVLQKNRTVASKSPPLLPPLLAIVSILANLYWVLLKKVREYIHLCLMLQTYTNVVKKATITLPRMPSKVDMPYKTFFRNTGHYYANNH